MLNKLKSLQFCFKKFIRTFVMATSTVEGLLWSSGTLMVYTIGQIAYGCYALYNYYAYQEAVVWQIENVQFRMIQYATKLLVSVEIWCKEFDLKCKLMLHLWICWWMVQLCWKTQQYRLLHGLFSNLNLFYLYLISLY